MLTHPEWFRRLHTTPSALRRRATSFDFFDVTPVLLPVVFQNRDEVTPPNLISANSRTRTITIHLAGFNEVVLVTLFNSSGTRSGRRPRTHRVRSVHSATRVRRRRTTRPRTVRADRRGRRTAGRTLLTNRIAAIAVGTTSPWRTSRYTGTPTIGVPPTSIQLTVSEPVPIPHRRAYPTDAPACTTPIASPRRPAWTADPVRGSSNPRAGSH